jgi:hypothetical protein
VLGGRTVSGVQLTPLATADPQTDALMSMLHEAFGTESVALAAFKLSGGRLPDCLLSHTLEGSRFDLSPLLLAEGLKHAAPALAQRVDPDRLFCFELLSPLLVSATVAEALAAGGPTCGTHLDPSAAHQLARDWFSALTGDRLNDVVVLHSRTAWSAWFGCEVWDRTWIIADCASSRVWLLCLTGDTAPWLPRHR